MDKAAIISAIVGALRGEFETLQGTSQKTRAAGNDEESKSEGKYDTRSTEDNYLADGLARQALGAAQAAGAYDKFVAPGYDAGMGIDLGALVEVELAGERCWFFLGPAGGGIEVDCEGVVVTVLTPESPLGRQLVGLKVGDVTMAPKGKVCAVE